MQNLQINTIWTSYLQLTWWFKSICFSNSFEMVDIMKIKYVFWFYFFLILVKLIYHTFFSYYFIT